MDGFHFPLHFMPDILHEALNLADLSSAAVIKFK